MNRSKIFTDPMKLHLLINHAEVATFRRWVSSKTKAALVKRPKKRVYHREHELDHAMDLQKRPSLVLQLKRLLCRHEQKRSMLVRDLEKEVGLIHKWNLMATIERYPRIFKVTGGTRKPLLLQFTDEAEAILQEEDLVRQEMEPLVVNNLRKLLMMARDARIPLHKIQQISAELGLPDDFQESLIPRYPQFFRVQDLGSEIYVALGDWDSALAVTARELTADVNGAPLTRRSYISRDGNFAGPHSFRIRFPESFKPRRKQLLQLAKWQNMPFPSPYGFQRELLDPRHAATQKRNIAVLHEMLSLTMEKRMSAVKLDMFHLEYRLPTRLLANIVRHNGIFYMTNKGEYSTVFLKEAYQGQELVDKCPLLRFYDKFFVLMGKRNFFPKPLKPAAIELRRVWSP